MARFEKDTAAVSLPISRFPNGDYFYVEMSRTNSHYDCQLMLAAKGNAAASVMVAQGTGRTQTEAQEDCYRNGTARFPRLPKPPYFKRGEYTFVASRNNSPNGGSPSRSLAALRKRMDPSRK